jgi:hypothetical protein
LCVHAVEAQVVTCGTLWSCTIALADIYGISRVWSHAKSMKHLSEGGGEEEKRSVHVTSSRDKNYKLGLCDVSCCCKWNCPRCPRMGQVMMVVAVASALRLSAHRPPGASLAMEAWSDQNRSSLPLPSLWGKSGVCVTASNGEGLREEKPENLTDFICLLAQCMG